MSFILNLSTLIKFCQLTYCEMDFYTSLPRGKMVLTIATRRSILLPSSRILLQKHFFRFAVYGSQPHSAT